MTKSEIALKVAALARTEAAHYPAGSPLWSYCTSWAEEAEEIATGMYDDPGAPFSVSRCLAELDQGLYQEFMDAWGYEVAETGVAILTVSDTMKQALKEKEKQ